MSVKRSWRKFQLFYRIDQLKQLLLFTLVFVFIALVLIESDEELNISQATNDLPILSVERSSKYKRYLNSQLVKYTPEKPEPRSRGYPGDLGKAVNVSYYPKNNGKKKSKKFHLNIVASDLVAEDRVLPDFRDELCKLKHYMNRLPQISVIIVFHNEAVSTLMRTVVSIINRSSRELIKEIILVDDHSDIDGISEELEEHLLSVKTSTRILKLNERNGLMKARVQGAKNASGEILVFFDAHVEVTTGWLEPLIEIIALNRTTVAVPVIDYINKDTFQYEKTEDYNQRSGFDLGLYHAWIGSHPNTMGNFHIEPFASPTMIGCAFAVDREFFFEVGAYDEGMLTWGGENIEQSIRVSRRK